MNAMAAFSTLNYAVLFAYLGAMIVIGWLFAGRQKTTEDFFLAGRNVPWLVVAMSMYASLTSAVTYMGLPGAAYGENISLIVVSVMSPIVAPFLIWIFYPFYRRLQVTTSYEYIDRRFGRHARFAVSGLFVLARLGWLGTVIYAPALALSVVSGLPLGLAIALMGLLATAYTVMGGLAADLWTDVVQFVIMIAGAIWVAWSLVRGVPGGVHGIVDIASAAGHLKVVDWHLSLYEMSGAVVAVSFFFQLLQDYGTDQVTVQRLMATRSFRGMASAVLFNALTDFFIVGLLLFIGLGLLAFYRTHPGLAPETLSGDQMLPFYIIQSLPNGVSGLIVTAIFAAAMSSMDSGISSISTVIVNDFVKPLRKTPADEAKDLRLARGLTLALGIGATLIAYYVSTLGHIIRAFATFMSLFSAPILALFLLGIFTRRAHFAGWVVGAAVAIPATLFLQSGWVKAHWVYFFPFSFIVTFAIGYAACHWMKRPMAERKYTIWGRRELEAAN